MRIAHHALIRFIVQRIDESEVEDVFRSGPVPGEPFFENVDIELSHLVKTEPDIPDSGRRKARKHVKCPAFAGRDNEVFMGGIHPDGRTLLDGPACDIALDAPWRHEFFIFILPASIAFERQRANGKICFHDFPHRSAGAGIAGMNMRYML